MCKVLKSYGIIAEHRNKVLALQTIFDKGERILSLVSYKDGMSIANRNLSKEDAIKLFNLLSTYLDYKPKTKEKSEVELETTEEPTGILRSLTTLPSGDCNYQTVLKKATVDEIASAISLMEESGGRHQTRIRVCKAELDRRAKQPVGTTESKDKAKAKTKVETKVESKEPKPRVLVFPTEDKKPKIIPLHTEGEHTYGECVVKIQKEAEAFKEDTESLYVLEGLRELCKVDQDFRNNFMREDKTYDGFWDYMYNAARNGYCTHYEGDNTRGNLDKDKALGLAIDYYNHDEVKQKEIEDAERAKKAEEAKKKAEALKKEVKKNGKKVGRKKGRTTA